MTCMDVGNIEILGMHEHFPPYQIKWHFLSLVLVDALIAYPPYDFPAMLLARG